MIDFDNTTIAFRHRSDRDLRRSWLLFSLLANPGLVRFANTLLKAAISISLPVDWLVKATVYKQFVGGETIPGCHPAVRMLEEFHVAAILDFSVEGGHSDNQVRDTLEETLRTIHNAAADPNVPFAVFKPTAFGDMEALAGMGMEDPGVLQFMERIDILCKAAREAAVPIMIDAEDSWYQDLVDSVVTAMMKRHNRERAVVFNTLQMYRHDRPAFLARSIAEAREGGYFYGVKFVRGAYMEKERKRALKMGYPSPIHPDKESTDRAFDDALRYSMENLDIVTVFNGTHNEKSCHLLAELMEKHGIEKNDKRVWFSQLYGMSDHISFNLADAGYNVAKYLPYGPVRHVMPYLFRRAEENTSVRGQTGRELRLVHLERKRRRQHTGV